MSPAHFILCVLSCIAFSGVTNAVYEDCKTPPPVDNARADLVEDEINHVNTAIYNCAVGYVMKGPNQLNCNVNTEEWQGDPPTCVKAKGTQHKKKMLSYPEEQNVPSELVPKLDLSCIQAKIQAPEISHGIVSTYERRRRGDKVFLVAYYACNENYDFERSQVYALFCSAKQWVGELPTCLPRVEYTDDDDAANDYDEDDYETTEDEADGLDSESQLAENPAENPVVPPPPPPPANNEDLQPQVETETIVETVVQPVVETVVQPVVETVVEPIVETEVQSVPSVDPQTAGEPVVVVPVESDAGQSKTEAATDISIVVAPTKDPYTPRLLDENCGEDRGGCAHKCERLLFPGENEPRLSCSCHKGYTLDPTDASSCLDIDECQESNGGCSQICNNFPGSFECACEKGYQIDVQTGNTCIDIDECINAELSAECANGCENLPGSYRCVIPLNNKEEIEEETDQDPKKVDDIEVELEPTKVETPVEPEVKSEPTPTLSCNPGFVLSTDASECQDINECDVVVEDDSNADHVPHRVCQQLCENTIGSFRCSCRAGYHLLEDQSSCAPDSCQDLDNPQLNRTRCAHQCENLANESGYVCVCPEGYTLGEDQHSCQVVETVCSREQGHERCRPGSCLVSEDNSTFSCLCPPGYASEIFSCQDIDECAAGTHKCSHDCFNTAGGYQCLCPRGMSLQQPEALTCVAPDPCAVNNNGCEQLCLSAEQGSCTCSKGFVLSDDNKSCTDIDECAVDNGGCQQLCRNLPGSHSCACDKGYELTDDGHSCQDVDECAGLLSGGCTHECINHPGSYECGCPLGYLLQEDEHSCQPALVGCPPGTRHTDKGCEPIDCGLGMLIGVDGDCVDIDECQVNNGGCSHLCENTKGSFKCNCPQGYQLATNTHDCEDVNECAVDNGGCQESCINEPGSFKCQCGEGKRLSFDQKTCLDLKPRTQFTSPLPEAVPAPRERPLPPPVPVAPAIPLFPSEIPDAPTKPLIPLSPLPSFTPSVTSASPATPLTPVAPTRPLMPLAPATPVTPSFPSLVRDHCERFEAPKNGQAHCNRYRHKRKLFYNTRCKVRCNPGFRLLGSEIRTCGATGNWEGEANKCVPLTQSRRVWMTDTVPTVYTQVSSCPALPVPHNGAITPSCTRGASKHGDSCFLNCNMGFAPVGGILTTCWNGAWTLGSVLDCKPFGFNALNNDIPRPIQAPWQIKSFGQQSLPLPVHTQPQHIKPYIKCPENVAIILNPLQTKAHVILQKPATNVDYRHVATSPAWAKQLQGHLPEGIHKIIFRAHDPVTGQAVGCQTIITIKRTSTVASQNPFDFKPLSLPERKMPARFPEFSFKPASSSKQFESLIDASPSSLTRPAEKLAEEPSSSRTLENARNDLGTSQSSYCPPSFEVQLKENQNLRSVLWEEPQFEGKLLKVFKSSFPGALFGVGDHTVKYEATTTDGRTLICSFQIHVKPGKPASVPMPSEINYADALFPSSPTQETHSSLIEGLESYVVCPNKEPIKVTPNQSVNLPVGCTLKNVRPQSTSLRTQPKHGRLTSLWRQYAHF
ncbi:uncharacterized protein LOC117786685 [Drosophila innubila]|uniref:uncharacterized protein LOC117786685 n=1 Tax=Drosophila innubila TaxID=198719 RepID=UPI00148BB343|nr:uncharacterized protein LOC117786685 [Drosophila innubila]